MNVHSDFSYSRQKLEVTLPFIERQVDKLNVIYSHEAKRFDHKKESYVATWIFMKCEMLHYLKGSSH